MEEEKNEHSLIENISNWAVQFGVTFVALTALLGILRIFHPLLPKDARSLLKTKRSSGVQHKAGRTYYYFRILSVFGDILSERSNQLADGSCLKLQVTCNIDGLPLFKSSSCQVWPTCILGMLQGFDDSVPRAIGIYCGSHQSSPRGDNSPVQQHHPDTSLHQGEITPLQFNMQVPHAATPVTPGNGLGSATLPLPRDLHFTPTEKYLVQMVTELPVGAMESLDALERRLKEDNQFRRQMVLVSSSIGGVDAAEGYSKKSSLQHWLES